MSDAHLRRQALDVRQSFLVKAPPGSGKTSLLAERFIAALLKVNHPEQVLAITFTRQAAAAMKRHVLGILDGKPAHSLTSQQLSHFRSRAERFPADKLNLQTIDSLAYQILANNSAGQGYAITTNADIYKDAAMGVLELAEINPELNEALNKHFAQKTTQSMIDGLAYLAACRDQWLLFMSNEHSLVEALRHTRHYADSEKSAKRSTEQPATNPATQHTNPSETAASEATEQAAWLELRLIGKGLLEAIEKVFQRDLAIDFIEQIFIALDLLNSARVRLNFDWPQFVLVDEFQDTSLIQLELINCLAKHAQSIFMVGDPLQSIYGFRAGYLQLFDLFSHGRSTELRLQPIQLEQNFRSSAGLIQWFNDYIEPMFAANADAGNPKATTDNNTNTANSTETDLADAFDTSLVSGADNADALVSIKPQINSYKRMVYGGERPQDYGATDAVDFSVECISATDEAQEADYIASWIHQELQSTTAKIGVLFRAHGHMRSVSKCLKQLNIDYSLPNQHEVQAVADIKALQKYMRNPADKLSGYTILRAPWCGLEAQSLIELADDNWLTCNINLLSDPDDRQRLTKLRSVLSAYPEAGHSLEQLHQLWCNLEGPNLYDQHDVTKIYDYLFGDRAALSAANDGARVKLLSMHAAKGLEFDSVVLPQLGRTVKSERLLPWQWLYLIEQGSHSQPLVARLQGEFSEWLTKQRLRCQRLESERLLYVALTRAKTKLLLSTSNKSKSGSLLELLHGAGLEFSSIKVNALEQPPRPAVYRRLPLAHQFAAFCSIEPSDGHALQHDGQDDAQQYSQRHSRKHSRKDAQQTWLSVTEQAIANVVERIVINQLLCEPQQLNSSYLLEQLKLEGIDAPQAELPQLQQIISKLMQQPLLCAQLSEISVTITSYSRPITLTIQWQSRDYHLILSEAPKPLSARPQGQLWLDLLSGELISA